MAHTVEPTTVHLTSPEPGKSASGEIIVRAPQPNRNFVGTVSVKFDGETVDGDLAVQFSGKIAPTVAGYTLFEEQVGVDYEVTFGIARFVSGETWAIPFTITAVGSPT